MAINNRFKGNYYFENISPEIANHVINLFKRKKRIIIARAGEIRPHEQFELLYNPKKELLQLFYSADGLPQRTINEKTFDADVSFRLIKDFISDAEKSLKGISKDYVSDFIDPTKPKKP